MRDKFGNVSFYDVELWLRSYFSQAAKRVKKVVKHSLKNVRIDVDYRLGPSGLLPLHQSRGEFQHPGHPRPLLPRDRFLQSKCPTNRIAQLIIHSNVIGRWFAPSTNHIRSFKKQNSNCITHFPVRPSRISRCCTEDFSWADRRFSRLCTDRHGFTIFGRQQVLDAVHR